MSETKADSPRLPSRLAMRDFYGIVEVGLLAADYLIAAYDAVRALLARISHPHRPTFFRLRPSGH